MMGLVAGGRLGDVNSVQKCSVVCVRIASLSCGQEAAVRAGSHQGYCPVVTPVSFPQTTRGDVAEAVLARDGGSSLSDVRHIILHASLQPARTSARRLRIKLLPFQPTTTLGVCSLLAPRLRSPELRDSQDPREITACRVPSIRSNSRSQSSRPATQLASLPRA